MSSLFHLSAKEVLSCLRYIAELRAQGKDWEFVAQELERSINEVRHFVFQHEEVFRVSLKKAHRDQKQLCYSVAFDVLRQQTASKNEKISHSSACMLLRMKLSDDRLRLKKLQEKMRAQANEQKKMASRPSLQATIPPADAVPKEKEKNTLMPPPNPSKENRTANELAQISFQEIEKANSSKVAA